MREELKSLVSIWRKREKLARKSREDYQAGEASAYGICANWVEELLKEEEEKNDANQ